MLRVIVPSSFFVLLLIVSGSISEKVIIDTDAGSDDAIAILMLLRAESMRKVHLPQYEIIGITCTYGNTKEENVEVNVLKTLTVAERSDIPVYAGAKKPLIGNFSTDNHFGSDGFGDADFDRDIKGEVDRSMHASVALVELTKKHEGNVSVILLGPTTNVALATSLDPSFTSRVKKFYVMGSSVAGIGLYRPNVEFNFGADPEANFILLNKTTSTGLTLFPWEAGLNAKIPKDWRINVLGKYDSPVIRFLNAIENVSLKSPGDQYTPTDAMTVATMLWPEMVNSTLETNVQAVFDGAAKGSILVDYYRTDKQRPRNARIIQSIDPEKLKEALVFYLAGENVEL